MGVTTSGSMETRSDDPERGLDLTQQVAPRVSFPLSVPIDGAWPDRFNRWCLA
jgi:hypothetical protein